MKHILFSAALLICCVALSGCEGEYSSSTTGTSATSVDGDSTVPTKLQGVSSGKAKTGKS